tara:strand:+ start:1646 stop:2494 length:849 start_codon:yes stop_codon:yes gene_type:complete
LKNIRIIPRLDIKGPNLVKGIHLEGLRVLGDPADFAKVYYEQGADEILYQDTVASLYERNSLIDIITDTSKEIFIPLTVGGGIREMQDIQDVLRAGADKVSINTASHRNPSFIDEASKFYGSSTIVIAIECLKKEDGKYYAFTDNGREETYKEVFSWAKEVEQRGAGEIFLTSIDKEGTGEGFDLELIREVTSIVDIPVVAHGGPSKYSHLSEVILDASADAISFSSMLHYQTIGTLKRVKQGAEGNIEFLKSNKSFKNFETYSLSEIKNKLYEEGFSVRPH